jgi:hypothetical protein
MTSKAKKSIFIVVPLLIIVGAIIGYIQYNKKHFEVKIATPAASVTATELFNEFSIDSANAKNKYIGDEKNQRVIEVSGLVSNVTRDQSNNTVILLASGIENSFINCTLASPTISISVGSTITVKGICAGYNFDTDLGIPGDVVLTRCVFVK